MATCVYPNVTPRHIYCKKSATDLVLFLVFWFFFLGEITSHAKFVNRTCFFFFFFFGGPPLIQGLGLNFRIQGLGVFLFFISSSSLNQG
jgi:hypothetical protein